MPLSVDTPAPPKKTMLSLPSIHSFNLAIFSSMILAPFVANELKTDNGELKIKVFGIFYSQFSIVSIIR